MHVTATHIESDDDAAFAFLAADLRRAFSERHSGHLAERNLLAARRGNEQVTHIIDGSATGTVEPHHEVKFALVLEHRPGSGSGERRADDMVDALDVQAVVADAASVVFDGDLRQAGRAFHLRRRGAFHRLHHSGYFRSDRGERIYVFTKNFDGDILSHAGH